MNSDSGGKTSSNDVIRDFTNCTTVWHSLNAQIAVPQNATAGVALRHSSNMHVSYLPVYWLNSAAVLH